MIQHINLHYMKVLLVILILASGFFSASETGMMAINRYRLRHLARKGNKSASRVVALLERPDRLLGVVLIGNTFANILAAMLATIIASHYFGDFGVFAVSILLTLIILIFAETMPKTLAVLYPQRVAFFAGFVLRILLSVFYPLVWLVNGIANSCLYLMGIKVSSAVTEALSADELRTVVREASSTISSSYQKMLLRVLELDQITVEDIMVPRHEIHGIDLNDNWNTILLELTNSTHMYMPVFRDNIDNVLGMLNLRKLLTLLPARDFNKDKLLQLIEEVYFIPEATPLNKQLANFKNEGKSLGLVVDEYGDIQGMACMQDLLEEIVGELSVEDVHDFAELIREQADASYIVDGNVNLRDLNRIKGWDFPTDGPKTLSGLIIEKLETIPTPPLGLRIAGYPIEILKVGHNIVRLVQIWPDQRKEKKS